MAVVRTMSDVQGDVTVVVDASGADGDQLMACVSTLVAETDSVTVFAAEPHDQTTLTARFGDSVRAYGANAEAESPTAAAGAVLTTTAQVVFARGSLARLAARAATPGRIVTRVLVSADPDTRTAWWSAPWAVDHRFTPIDLARADLAFDRTHLRHDSPQARAWVRGDDIGVVSAADAGPDVASWTRAEGRRLARHARMTALRARAGEARRRWMLYRQRRRRADAQRVR